MFALPRVALALGVLAAALLVVPTSAQAAGAVIDIVNVNAPGVGFNDPTPAAPVGGNPGTTLGEQRLNVFREAARIWGETLDSNVHVRVRASMVPLAAGVLGSTGVLDVEADFPGTGNHPGALVPGTWYPKALANKLAGFELNPAIEDYQMRFSSTFDFYLGLDNNHGAKNDLAAVLLHEFAHGLGFSSQVSRTSGTSGGNPFFVGQYLCVSLADPSSCLPDIYTRHMFDNTRQLHWDEMATDAERATSMTNWGNVIWDGDRVSADVPAVLAFGSPEVRVLSPLGIAGIYEFGTAAFGGPLPNPGLTADVVAAVDAADAAGPATTDGCSAFTNAAAVGGRYAIVERGTCGFVVKAKNAQDAGAIGVIIYNNAANAAAAPPGMAGVDPTVTIPAVSLTRAAGLGIVNAPSTVSGSLGLNLAIRAGADSIDRARLYEPTVIAPGSSTSHYDTVAFPNQLMEPFINGDLTHNVDLPNDLTHDLLLDIGWFADADLDGVADGTDCEANSDLSATLIIGGCNTGVVNQPFADGCTIADNINHFAAAAANHGGFVSAVAHYADALKKSGLIKGSQHGAIVSCAAKSNLP